MTVHLTPSEPRRDGIAVVVDLIRASTTITTALAHGAAAIRPCVDIDEARTVAVRDEALLGGERHGVRIEGFDLGNSPSEYAPEIVKGRTIAFTTTNGTRALAAAAGSKAVVVGALVNRGAVVAGLLREALPVSIVCAGEHGRIAMEDVICAGAFVHVLTGSGSPFEADDAARLAHLAWEDAVREPGRLMAALNQSRGGRNLARVGLEADIPRCARIDVLDVVPAFDAATGLIVAQR